MTNGRPAMSVAAGRRMAAPARGRVMPLAPGVVLGIGLGGFLDGILLHQILQWHHMLTSAGYPADSVVNLEINTLFDGLFHAVTWIAVAAGLFLLHRAAVHGAAWSWQRLVGGMAIGWGAFNLVEGVVDHHLLGLHHVKESAMHPLAWDLGFLLLGAALVVGGALLARRVDPGPPWRVPRPGSESSRAGLASGP